jgi:hypothetical protein
MEEASRLMAKAGAQKIHFENRWFNNSKMLMTHADE